MKKKYEVPDFFTYLFEYEDVITLSEGGVDPGDDRPVDQLPGMGLGNGGA